MGCLRLERVRPTRSVRSTILVSRSGVLPGPKVLVSQGVGRTLAGELTGKEIFYRSADGNIDVRFAFDRAGVAARRCEGPFSHRSFVGSYRRWNRFLVSVPGRRRYAAVYGCTELAVGAKELSSQRRKTLSLRTFGHPSQVSLGKLET